MAQGRPWARLQGAQGRLSIILFLRARQPGGASPAASTTPSAGQRVCEVARGQCMAGLWSRVGRGEGGSGGLQGRCCWDRHSQTRRNKLLPEGREPGATLCLSRLLGCYKKRYRVVTGPSRQHPPCWPPVFPELPKNSRATGKECLFINLSPVR